MRVSGGGESGQVGTVARVAVEAGQKKHAPRTPEREAIAHPRLHPPNHHHQRNPEIPTILPAALARCSTLPPPRWCNASKKGTPQT